MRLALVGSTFLLMETNVLFTQLTPSLRGSLPFSPGKNDVLVNERNCSAAEISPRGERGQCVCRSGKGVVKDRRGDDPKHADHTDAY